MDAQHVMRVTLCQVFQESIRMHCLAASSRCREKFASHENASPLSVFISPGRRFIFFGRVVELQALPFRGRVFVRKRAANFAGLAQV